MLLKKLILKYYQYRNPLKYAKLLGVKLGEDCRLIGSPSFGSEPWLIEIGNHVEISGGVRFITHDGATWCFIDEERYNRVIRFGKIVIKNNCFIGAGSTILATHNITIGENSIVGACSLVTKDIPSGEVWAGVPARYVCTTKEYAEKCLRQCPDYDWDKFIGNKKKEVLKIVNKKN